MVELGWGCHAGPAVEAAAHLLRAAGRGGTVLMNGQPAVPGLGLGGKGTFLGLVDCSPVAPSTVAAMRDGRV